MADAAAQPSDQADAATLANDLGCLPLALEQAGAFIVEDGCSIAEYRQLWKAHDVEVITGHDLRAMKYPRSVATTWQTSVDRLSEDGRALLNILCWMSSDPIPLGLIECLTRQNGVEPKYGEHDEPAINVRVGRRDLARYSLVRWTDEQHDRISIHRLVQEITRFRLPVTEQVPRLKQTLQMAEFFVRGSDPQDVRWWPQVYDPGHRHLASIIEHADNVNIAQPTSLLMNNLGLYYLDRADYFNAEPLRKLLSIRESP